MSDSGSQTGRPGDARYSTNSAAGRSLRRARQGSSARP